MTQVRNNILTTMLLFLMSWLSGLQIQLYCAVSDMESLSLIIFSSFFSVLLLHVSKYGNV